MNKEKLLAFRKEVAQLYAAVEQVHLRYTGLHRNLITREQMAFDFSYFPLGHAKESLDHALSILNEYLGKEELTAPDSPYQEYPGQLIGTIALDNYQTSRMGRFAAPGDVYFVPVMFKDEETYLLAELTEGKVVRLWARPVDQGGRVALEVSHLRAF